MKVCRRCGSSKPLDEFYTHPETRDGRNTYCKECQKAKAKQWAKDNPEKRREACRRYHAASRDVRQAWYAANRSEVLEKTKKWAKSNPEKRREILRRWRKKNRAYMAAKQQEYKARKKAAVPPDACLATIEKIYVLCSELNRRSKRRGGWEVDHTVPLSRGGSHHPDNLQVVPAKWNRSKCARHADRWPGKYPPWVAAFCVDLGLDLT